MSHHFSLCLTPSFFLAFVFLFPLFLVVSHLFPSPISNPCHSVYSTSLSASISDCLCQLSIAPLFLFFIYLSFSCLSTYFTLPLFPHPSLFTSLYEFPALCIYLISISTLSTSAFAIPHRPLYLSPPLSLPSCLAYTSNYLTLLYIPHFSYCPTLYISTIYLASLCFSLTTL